MPFPPFQLPLDRLADEIRAPLFLFQDRINPVKRPLWETGRGLLMVYLASAHARKIDDITNCYKHYFAVALSRIDDII